MKQPFHFSVPPFLQVPVNRAMSFINSRQPREKQMIFILLIVFAIVVDYFLVIQPIATFFTKNLPEVSTLRQQKQSLEEDKKNAQLIQKNLNDIKDEIGLMDARFIDSEQISNLLENLSDLASRSGVRILSVKPFEAVPSVLPSRYAHFPIQMNATAGTHEFGSFLAKLENDSTLFKVTDMQIIGGNPDNPRKHGFLLKIEAIQKVIKK